MSILKFTDYIVDCVNFKYNHEFAEAKEVELNVKFDVAFEVESLTKFQTILSVSLFDKTEVTSKPFQLDVSIRGDFEITDADISRKDSEEYMQQSSVAILFPYIRALVTSYSSLNNVAPVILPPINIVEYFNVSPEMQDHT